VKEYPRRTCTVCGEDKNMFGGCRCNGYTTAFNKESQQTAHNKQSTPCQHGLSRCPFDVCFERCDTCVVTKV